MCVLFCFIIFNSKFKSYVISGRLYTSPLDFVLAMGAISIKCEIVFYKCKHFGFIIF